MRTVIGQANFGGGMDALNPGQTQYVDSLNIAIRDGKASTRPGIRRLWRQGYGFDTAFYFNQDNARYNDADHTGFWFDAFEFVSMHWAGVQTAAVIRRPSDEAERIVFVTGGIPYLAANGYAERIACAVAVGADEQLSIVQAGDYIIMFRGEALAPLWWDGSAMGFVAVPTPAPELGDPMPQASGAVYHAAGRLWTFRDRDDVWASDILDVQNWDEAGQLFSIKPGDGDEIVALHPFHGDTILVFKRNSVTAIVNVTAVVDTQADPPETLADYVAAEVIDAENGLAAPAAKVTVGEDVWWLAWGGILSLRRNGYGNLERQPVAISKPIQPLIDRINWDAVARVQATVFDNYVLWAVPLDGSTENNGLLVYDLLAPGAEGGAWVGLWQSQGRILSVRSFFRMGRKALYLDADGVVRELFVDDMRDSDEALADTPEFDAATDYQIGALVRSPSGGAPAIWRAAASGSGETPGTGSQWVLETDPQHVYDIATELTSRLFTLDDGQTPFKLSRAEILFRHQAPRVSVWIRSADYRTEAALFEAVEYAATEYDVAGRAPWAPATDAAGLTAPHRKDYTVRIGEDGLLIGTAGVRLGVWETHALRFLRRMINDRSVGLRLRSDRGRIRVEALTIPVDVRRAAVTATV